MLTTIKLAELFASTDYHKKLNELKPYELHNAIAKAIMTEIQTSWNDSKQKHLNTRCAYYFSAEFLVGRAIFNNLFCLGKEKDIEQELKTYGLTLNSLEEIEDLALGNGGLGRLAACFLDSASTLNLPLDGYGIRYKYGIFKQTIEDGCQKEYADDWTRYGDMWSLRCDDDIVNVEFADMTVKAVPYDMPVIGYATKHIGTLRLWQCEPITEFDFQSFNNQEYDKSVKDKNRAEDISRVLYPNDSTQEGKILRFRQQYFFCSASLKDIIKNFKKIYGDDFDKFADYNTIQLNDTHPVISTAEFIRLLTQNENIPFEKALDMAKKVFNYTNHTVMQEALEKWSFELINSILPEVAQVIVQINNYLKGELESKGISKDILERMLIIQDNTVHMAYLATYVSSYVNGVAELHTEILKDNVLNDWFKVYPEKFQNKTNGITQRRWLGLCNPELSKLITELIGSENWLVDLSLLKNLEQYVNDENIIKRFGEIKQNNKKCLCEYVKQHDNVELNSDTIFDIQVKRLHEYKRQFLNILVILELYFEIKEGSLTDFQPTTFIFGAKSAPGYLRAKGIIKLINEVAKLIDNDKEVSKYMKVIFVQNYNVSYAEKIVSAGNVSVQISTAGTEASGTGNMKFMLNGAVTLGTYDGANIEIVKEAGEENNYIFGARVEDIEKIKNSYSPKEIYEKNPKVKRVMDALINGTLNDGGTGIFKELFDSILDGAEWHKADQYYLLLDFDSYLEERLKLNNDYKDRFSFNKKCWLNMCNAGKFSSDRTIKEYADDIWHIKNV